LRYKTQAIIGVCGLIATALFLVVSYAFLTEVSWLIPAFSIPFMVGFAYYSYASLKEGREVRERRKAGR
jgi:CHASE2 domain-containing sensor protein